MSETSGWETSQPLDPRQDFLFARLGRTSYICGMLSSLDITKILAKSSGYLLDAEVEGIKYYRKERTIQLYVKQ